MTTFLAIGDPHFKTSNITECKQMIINTCNLIAEKTPDFVVCLGDILHTHEKIHIEALCVATNFIEEIAKLVPIYVIIGNHDRCNNSDFLTDKHAFNGLKNKPNIEIIDTTKEYHIKGDRFVMVPYVEPGRFMEALNKIDNPIVGTRCIFAHQEFLGAKLGPRFSEDGDPWPLNNPLIISGHIHDYDMLQRNIIYVGTPMQHAFGDTADKTVSLFTLKELDYVEERLDLGLIKRKIIYMKISELNDAWTPPDNCLVKLVLKGSESELKTAAKHPKITQLRSNGIKVDTKLDTKRTSSPLADPTPHKNFLEVLYERVSQEPSTVEAYTEIFAATTA